MNLVFSLLFRHSHDLSVVVSSGSNLLNTRCLSIIKTWANTLPSISFVTDYVPESFNSVLQTIKFHSNVTFIQLPDINTSEHLIGTLYDKSPWIYAQPRFLVGLYHLYQNNPNSKWYALVDDDTYIFTKSIIRRLSSYNFQKEQVVSYF
jgi:hypothetical protein